MLLLLFDFVNECLDNGQSLSQAFSQFAAKNGYTFKSVKKCFAAAIQGLKSRPALCRRLNVDLSKLTDTANIFNMAAVKKNAEEAGGDLNKTIFALCLGDQKEMSALRKRFERFFPQSAVDTTNIDFSTKKPIFDKTMSFAMALQAKYCFK